MGKLVCLAAVLCLIGFSAGNKRTDYQYDEYNYHEYNDYEDDDIIPREETQETEVVHIPVILTEPKQIVVDLGTTIRLPCMVDHLPEAVSVIWKRPDTEANSIIAIGDAFQVADYKSRANLEITNKGSILNIGVASTEDAGQYQCSLGVPGQNSDSSIKHSVSIRVPPTISTHSETYIETEKGKQVLMECKGTGTPSPTVKWTRLGKGKMPDGSNEINGETFVIPNVDRHHAGVYRCTANNGFSKEAAKEIELRVLYKPEITVEEVFVHTKAGDKAELVCKVHGTPKPKVEWKKDGQPIVEGGKIKLLNMHSKHSLIIKSVEKSDFGEYTCHASSERGSASETLEISGLAKAADFKSDWAGREENSYLLEWTVNSYSPVTAFRVDIREEGTTAWKEYTADPIEDGAYHYAGKLFLKEMKGSTRYESRVYARNEEGWNKPEDVFPFATKGAEPKQEGITSSSSSNLAALLPVLLGLLFSRLCM